MRKGGEKLKNIIFVFCLALVIMAGGCGSMTETKGDVSEGTYVMKADNPKVREFNRTLGAISDETSAENAVNSFVGYVDSRLDKSASGNTVQSLGALLCPAVIKEMARREVAVRNAESIGVNSISGSENVTPPIDIGTITDNINELGTSEGVRVDDETVSKVQVAVEESVPNMNPENKPGMTPLEASVVAYSLVSGDDGTATEGSVKVPSEKIGAFVGTITN